MVIEYFDYRGEKFYKDEIWDEMKNHKISARFAQNKAERLVVFLTCYVISL